MVFNGCIYNHRELRAELEARGHALPLRQRHRGAAQGLGGVGRGDARPARGHVRLLPRRARVGALRARARPARDQAAVPAGPAATAACASPPRCRRSWRRGGVDTRVDPVALHHYLSFHSIVPAPRTILRGVRKLPPATVLVLEPDGRRRERRYWDPPFERDPARADWSAEDWEARDHGRAAGGGAAAHGRRRAGRDPALGRPGLEPDRRAARRAGPARPRDVLGRLPRRRRARRATSSSSPTSWPPSSGPTTTRSGSGRSGCCRRCRGRSRR